MLTSCVSRRQPFGKSGRSGRSIMRAISVAFSPARPSRLKNEPGIFPAAYMRSSTSTVSGRKSTSRRFPAVAVFRTTVSPERTTTAPDACLAIQPVSNEISVPPISTETRCTSGMCPSFLCPPFGRQALCIVSDASVVVACHGSRKLVARRIIIFGATGFTGRLVAERLAVQGASPVLAGRTEASVRELAERLGAEWRVADALRRNSVFALLERGDVLVSTVGPFAKWGEPAVRAAIAAGGTYIDSTGEAAFIRRVSGEFGPPAERAGASLLTAMGYDFVPGALAAALALEEAGAAVRVDIGYYAFGMTPSAGTRASSVGILLDDSHAFRDGALTLVRNSERVRSFTARGKERAAVSIGGAEHLTLPASYPRLREINTYLGWFGRLARPLQAASLAGSLALRVPGAR